MSKKTKVSKKKKHSITAVSPVSTHFDLIGRLLLQGNYAEAVVNCERLLNYLPQGVPQRVDLLTQLGTAQGMLQNFKQSYAAFNEALLLEPKNADIWYNRSRASRFTSRFGQALRDLERAIELNTRSDLSEKFPEQLQFSRQLVEDSLKMRGPYFTLDQLIEQEDLFQQGLAGMESKQWEKAGQAFQASIALGDCLPSPWGNLGICLMMQERYDESEAAFKRALEVDPDYTLAKNNLAGLPETRRTGIPGMVVLNEPFRSSKLKQSITFLKE